MKKIDYDQINMSGSFLSRIARSMVVIIIALAFSAPCKAQLLPFQSSYFQNRYYLDPAMAGIDKGLDINLGYRQQWTGFPGAPKYQSLTASYAATDRVGLGLNVNNDQSGLIRQTRVMGTYAYHIPLNQDADKLSFGLSFGISSPSVDYNSVNGDQTDGQIANYNQMRTYVDGDFGAAYTSNALSVEAAVPNLKTVLFGNSAEIASVDRTVFIASARYKILVHSGVGNLSFEPLVVFRNVKGFDNIYDAGVSLNLTDYNLNLEGVYHSSRSVGLGVGAGPKAFHVNLAYDLETGAINTYSSGTFELGLKIKL